VLRKSIFLQNCIEKAQNQHFSSQYLYFFTAGDCPTGNLGQPACTLSREAVVWKEILMLFYNGEFPVVEPLLSGIVLGLVIITLAGLFVAAYLQYKRGDQIG
jgi:cytochrome b6-f complex subunit 5